MKFRKLGPVPIISSLMCSNEVVGLHQAHIDTLLIQSSADF